MNGRYLLQVLVAVAKGCRPNSPYAARAWLRVFPIHGLPEFGDALGALVRHGYLLRGPCNTVKPSEKGYECVTGWKRQRAALRARPVLYDRLIWDVGTAQEEYISVPDGSGAGNAPHCRVIGNRRVSPRPSRHSDLLLQMELRKIKPMRGTLAHAVITGEVSSDLMYRVAPDDSRVRP